MPNVKAPTIQSFKTIGLELVALIPRGCRDKCSKWQKRGMQLQAIATKLEQENTQEAQHEAQKLVGRVSDKLETFSSQVESESLKQIKKEVKYLSRKILQEFIPEGVSSDGKIYIISQKLLEGGREAFWQVISELNSLNDNSPSPPLPIKIGNFIYERELLERYENFPIYELATSVKCYLKHEESKELSIVEARILIGYRPQDKMPQILNFPHVDSAYWDYICTTLIKKDVYFRSSPDTADQLIHLQAFVTEYRQSKVDPVKLPSNDSLPLMISPHSLSLPAMEFRTEMRELLNNYNKAEFIHLLFDCPDLLSFDPSLEFRHIFFDNHIKYRLHRKDFLRLLDDLEIDPTFKEERKNQATCRFRNEVEKAVSLLEIRVLLGLSPWDKLPESLDMTQIPLPYFPFLLKTAWNPMNSLPSSNRWYSGVEAEHDEIYFLERFLANHRPAEHAEFIKHNWLIPYHENWPRSDKPYLSVSNSFFQLSRTDLEDFLFKALNFKEVRLNLCSGDCWKIKKDLLDRLVSNPQFSPADLSNELNVVLMDGLLHRVPMIFYDEVLSVFLQKKDLTRGPDGLLRPFDLSTISPNVFHDAIDWFKYQQMRPSALQRMDVMIVFLQQCSPDSYWTREAQAYLANHQEYSFISEGMIDEDWTPEVSEEDEDRATSDSQKPLAPTVPLTENVPVYTDPLIEQLTKEKNVPFAPNKFFMLGFYLRIGLIAGAAIALVGVVWRTQAVRRIFAATTYESGFGPTHVHRIWTFVMQKTKSIFAPLHTAIQTIFRLSGTPV